MTHASSLPHRDGGTAALRPGRDRLLVGSFLLLALLGAGSAATVLGARTGSEVRSGPVIIPVPPRPRAAAARPGPDLASDLRALGLRTEQVERRLEVLRSSLDELRATVAALAQRGDEAPTSAAPTAGTAPPRFVGSVPDGARAEVADASDAALARLSDAEPRGPLPAAGAARDEAPASASARAAASRAGSAAYRAGDYAAAERAWCPLAQAGDARARFHLAALYYEGRVGPRDLVAARAWAGLAADQGHPLAPDLLARLEGEMTPDQLEASRQRPAECNTAAG